MRKPAISSRRKLQAEAVSACVLDDDEEDAKAFVQKHFANFRFTFDLGNHERLMAKLEDLGFAAVKCNKVEYHPVFIFRGRIGKSGCTSEDSIRKLVSKLMRGLGSPIPRKDIYPTVDRGRFQVVLMIPSSPAIEAVEAIDLLE